MRPFYRFIYTIARRLFQHITIESNSYIAILLIVIILIIIIIIPLCSTYADPSDGSSAPLAYWLFPVDTFAQRPPVTDSALNSAYRYSYLGLSKNESAV